MCLDEGRNWVSHQMHLVCALIFLLVTNVGQLQPLDVSINEPFKHYLKEVFSLWYSEKVKEQLHGGTLQLSTSR